MAFGAQIATAFVRIRPNMTGFKSETEAGVKSSFSGLAKVAGLALGAGAAFEFGKGVVQDAAAVQKSVETVNAEFGKAGGAIKRFANDAGLSLGIASHASEATAARFGILFNNLGIGQKEGAGMTVGLLKLAGALSAIRGVDPETVLARLPLALAGNLRSLKQLGLAVDANQIKLAAFKLGLIGSVKDALTPAAKAQAIYALATAKLPGYLDLAKKHSGDLVNVQRRLSAEWDHAREALGKALLPELTRAITAFERWLSKMEKSGKLQADFNAIARTTATVVKGIVGAVNLVHDAFKTLSGAVGGAKTVLVAFFTVLAIQKIRNIAGAIIGDLVQNGFRQLQIATAEEQALYLEAFGTMEVATIGLGATIKSALITSGIGALVLAIGLAVAYVITHWSQVKNYTIALGKAIVAVWSGLKQTLIGIAEVIGGAMTTQLTAPLRALLKVAGFLGGLFDKIFGTNISGSLKKAQDFIDRFSTDLVKRGAKNTKEGVTRGFKDAASAWSEALSKSAKSSTFNDHLTKTGKNVGSKLTQAAIDATATGAPKVTRAVSAAMQTAIDRAHERIAASIASAKSNLTNLTTKLSAEIQKIQEKLGLAGGAIASSPQGAAFKKLKDLIASGAPSFAIARANQEFSSQLANVGKGQKNDASNQIAKLKDAFLKQQISATTFQSRFTKILAEQGATAKNAAKALGVAGADEFNARVRGVRQQVAALAAVPAKLRGTGGTGADSTIKIIRPLDVIRQQDAKIGAQASKERARIAKAAEKTAATLAQLKNVQTGPLPGHGKTPPGHAAKKAKKAASSGIQA